MLIEAPIAVVKTSDNRDKANQFIRFTRSDQAQRIWAEWGFRPVVKKVYREFKAKFPARPTVYRISDPIFGGWQQADKKWFDPKGSIMVDIEKSIGGPTG
jgi:sulfate transport system substrate-binding protein